jgi:hypothetical protein
MLFRCFAAANVAQITRVSPIVFVLWLLGTGTLFGAWEPDYATTCYMCLSWEVYIPGVLLFVTQIFFTFSIVIRTFLTKCVCEKWVSVVRELQHVNTT